MYNSTRLEEIATPKQRHVLNFFARDVIVPCAESFMRQSWAISAAFQARLFFHIVWRHTCTFGLATKLRKLRML